MEFFGQRYHRGDNQGDPSLGTSKGVFAGIDWCQVRMTDSLSFSLNGFLKSAGGFGAFSNLDHIADLMSEAAPSTRVVGLIDSGWLMNSTQFKPSNCAIYETCALYIAFGKGVK